MFVITSAVLTVLPLKQLRQLYCNLIHPYLSYAIIAWGSVSASHLKKSQTKSYYPFNVQSLPRHMVKIQTVPPFNELTRHTYSREHFSHQWHKKQFPSIFNNYFRYASGVHTYNTRYASKSNFYKAPFKTNIGKTTLSTLAVDHWQKLPHDIKELNLFIFPRKAKQYLLRKQ